MLKITVRYADEVELLPFINDLQKKHTVKCKPPLSQPGKKGPDSDYYRRDIWLENTINSAENACRLPDIVV